jgi:archaetidylinositol phosphate synthase
MVRNSIVKHLVGTSVSPNQITAIRVMTGVIAAIFMAGGPQWQSIGGCIFLVSVILDRIDGDLARLTECTSHFGHRFDMISDAICNVLVFLGLGIGLMGGDLGSWAILIGGVSGASVVTILWVVMKMEEASGARAAELSNFSGFDADDAVLLIPIFIWLGYAESLLIISCFIAPLVSLLFLRMYRRQSYLPNDY